MTLRRWMFEVAPAGTTLSTSNVLASDATAASVVAAGTGTITSSSGTPGVKQGTYCAEFVNDTTGSTVVRLPFAASHDVGAVNAYWSVTSTPSSSRAWHIFSMRHSAGSSFQVSVNTSNRLIIMSSGTTLATSSGTITFNRRNRLEVIYNRTLGNVTANLYNDDSLTPDVTVSCTGQSIGSASYVAMDWGPSTGPSTVITQRFDAIGMNDGATSEIGPLTNSLPTVTCGANQDVAAPAAVTVTSSASDSDGSIASRLWTFDYAYPSTPSLTGSTSANASFTAGAAGSLYVLRCTATDNDGGTGYATTEVRVPSSGTMTTLPGDGTGTTWTNVGGAATQGEALADASDATYVESATVTGVEQTHRWRLTPSQVRSTGTITVRVSQDVAGTLTAKARLFEGNTQRQEWTLTVTTSIADQTLTLSGGTISAITDWGNLYLELSAT